MITGKGAGFLAAALAIFMLGRLAQVGWLYLVDAVLWGIILLSAAVPWLNVFPPRALRWIEGPDEKGGPPSPTEGDPVAIRITLRKPNLLAPLCHRPILRLPVGGPQQAHAAVLRHGAGRLRTGVHAFQSGGLPTGQPPARSADNGGVGSLWPVSASDTVDGPRDGTGIPQALSSGATGPSR